MIFDIKEQLNLRKYMPDKNNLKNLSTFFYAFSDYTRLQIIILLFIKPLCVGDISQVLNVNQTTVSHQLKILKALNIVSFERSGKNLYYFIKNNQIENVLDASVECI